MRPTRPHRAPRAAGILRRAHTQRGRGAWLAPVAALLVTAVASPASANNAMPQLFGPELLRPLGVALIVLGACGGLIGTAVTALTFSARAREALGSNLAVFTRGVVVTMGLGTLFASGFLFLLGALIVADEPWLTGPIVVSLVTLPGTGALVLGGELSYAAYLYRQVHRARADRTSAVLATLSVVLVVPCVIVALLFSALGTSLALEQLAPNNDVPEGLLLGLGGILLSALTGMAGLALALSGKVRSTRAIVARGTVMFASVAVFAASGLVFWVSADALAKSAGSVIPPPLPDLFAVGVIGLTSLLAATELGIGGTLHWQRGRERERPAQRAIGVTSLGLALLCGACATLMLLLGAIGVLAA